MGALVSKVDLHRQRIVISPLEACVVYSFSIVVITNYQELGGLNNTNVYLKVPWVLQSRCPQPASLSGGSGEDLFLCPFGSLAELSSLLL